MVLCNFNLVGLKGLEHRETLKLCTESHWKTGYCGNTCFCLLFYIFFLSFCESNSQNTPGWECYCRFIKVSEWSRSRTAILYLSRHSAMCWSQTRTSLLGDFSLRMLKFAGMMSLNPQLAANTTFELKNAAHTFFSFLFFFCSSRISKRIIQCDGVLEWQNAPLNFERHQGNPLWIWLRLQLQQTANNYWHQHSRAKPALDIKLWSGKWHYFVLSVNLTVQHTPL